MSVGCDARLWVELRSATRRSAQLLVRCQNGQVGRSALPNVKEECDPKQGPFL